MWGLSSNDAATRPVIEFNQGRELFSALGKLLDNRKCARPSASSKWLTSHSDLHASHIHISSSTESLAPGCGTGWFSPRRANDRFDTDIKVHTALVGELDIVISCLLT